MKLVEGGNASVLHFAKGSPNTVTRSARASVLRLLAGWNDWWWEKFYLGRCRESRSIELSVIR